MIEPTFDEFKLMARPSGYAIIRLGLEPYPWQCKVMDSLMENNTRAAYRGCNSSGKTAVMIAGLVLWHMEVFPGSMCVTMSASNRQIKFQLYPQFHRLVPRLGKGWKVRDSNEYSVKAPNGSRCISFSTDNKERVEGYHEWEKTDFFENWEPPADWNIGDWTPDSKAPLLMIFDEAKGIGDDKFDAASRCMATREFHASSPGDPKGRFYDHFNSMKSYFKNRQGGFNLFSANIYDCPHLIDDPNVREQSDNDIEVRGEKHWLVQSKWFGNFAKSGEHMVFDLFKVEDAMGDIIPHVNKSERRCAVDLSGGRDKTVIYVREGNRCWLDSTFQEADAEVLVKMLVKRFEALCMKGHWIRVDAGGLGDPICDMLYHRGFDVERMQFGAKPRHPRKFGNARCEMYNELAERINGREIILPRVDRLKEQLGWIKYKKDEDDGRLWLEKKSTLPYSPDDADTIAMLFYKTPRMDSYLSGRNNGSGPASKYSPLPGVEWNQPDIMKKDEALLY